MKSYISKLKFKVLFVLILLCIIALFIFYFNSNEPQYRKVIEWDIAGNDVKTETITKVDFNESCNTNDLLKVTSGYESRIIIYCNHTISNTEDKNVKQTKFLPFSEIVSKFQKIPIKELPELKLTIFLFDEELQNTKSTTNKFQVPLKWQIKGENSYSDEIVINDKKITIIWGMEPKNGHEITKKEYVSEREELSDILARFNF